jgi:hypothetical protein
MRKHIVLFAMLAASLLFAGGAYAGSVYYVQSVRANILSGPSFRSPAIAKVAIGQQLAVKSRDRFWLKVVYHGKVGYVFSLLASSHPPLKRRGFIKANDSEINRGVRRRSSYFASAAAARGLTREDRRRADTEGRADYKSLERMEKLSFSDDEVSRFMEGGKP